MSMGSCEGVLEWDDIVVLVVWVLFDLLVVGLAFVDYPNVWETHWFHIRFISAAGCELMTINSSVIMLIEYLNHH